MECAAGGALLIKNFASDQLHVSVQGIVGLLQAELDGLIKQKADFKRRRRSLSRVLRSLVTKPGTTVTRGLGPLKSSRFRKHVNRARANTRESYRMHDDLRRACRIAFMEAGGLATPDEIFGSIVRRGSFSFCTLGETPHAAIVRTLHFMAQAKEVHCITGDPRSQWKYTSHDSHDTITPLPLFTTDENKW